MSTDILFVNLPPYGSYYAEGVPHLGMLYVLTGLRHHGYTVSYLDCACTHIRHHQILQHIKKAKPRMVGFSVDTDNLFSVAHMTHELKNQMGSELPIILGGPASNGQSQEIMERCAADVLVIGEGEFTTQEVADCLLRGRGQLEKISGICYRSPNGLVNTLPRDPIQDLDALPFPDRSFVPEPKKHQVTLLSGRGCPYRCTFCFEGRMGNRYRHRSPENIIDEIEYLVSFYKKPLICINDDTFIANPDHAIQVCRLLRERFKPWEDLLLFCEVRADVVDRHPELIEEMVRAGVARIQIGVESADRDVLRGYNKLNVKPEVVERVVKAFHEAGLPSIYGGFMLGGPRESMETMQRTLDFAKHLLIDVAPGSFEANACFLTPLPGTDIYIHPETYGLKLLDSDLITSSNFNFCVTETETLTQEMINNFHSRFKRELDSVIRGIIPNLPWEVIETHAKLEFDFHLSTAYNENFYQFPRLVEYLTLVGEGRFERTDSLSDEEMLERFPQRLSISVEMEGDQLTIPKGPTTLTLNSFGSRIYSLCSGKLKTREIIERLSELLAEKAPPRDTLQNDTIEFLRHLDKNYAVFFKDF